MFHPLKKNMKNVYPVLIRQDKNDYLAYIPDIDRMTEGSSFYNAINMARDLLGTYSIDCPVPDPSSPEKALEVTKSKADEDDFKYSEGILVYIDIDFDEYKRKYDNRKVKKNCTIPSWLNEKAEAAGVNFSRILQDALIEKLGE